MTFALGCSGGLWSLSVALKTCQGFAEAQTIVPAHRCSVWRVWPGAWAGFFGLGATVACGQRAGMGEQGCPDCP